MNKVADTLADGGHNVTLLQTYMVEHWGRKIRLAKNKNVTIIDYHLTENNIDENTTASAHKNLWDHEAFNSVFGAVMPMFVLHEEFSPMCKQIYADKQLHDTIRRMNIHGYAAEAFDFCSLFLGDHLKLNLLPMFSSIKSVPVSRAMGEPSLLNYAPTFFTKYGPEQTIWDRLKDIPMATSFYYAFSSLFNRQYNQAYSLLNGDVRHWTEIVQTSTFFFYNNNPYIGFPMPCLEKSVEIGGFTIDSPKNVELDEEYDRILNLRNSTVLASFGTVVLSSDMPDKFKHGLIKAFSSLPNTTFIWKYEKINEEVLLNLNVPSNVILKEWVPQPAILADERLSLFVTHGGLGSTLEVAYSGKPSIIIPVFGDQLFNAKMLSRHGGARAYNKYDLEHSELLVEAIRDVIFSETYLSNAQRLAQILRNQPFDPKANLLRHAEFSARFGRVTALEPYNVHYNFIQYYMLDAFTVYMLVISLSFYLIYVAIAPAYRKFVKLSAKYTKLE